MLCHRYRVRAGHRQGTTDRFSPDWLSVSASGFDDRENAGPDRCGQGGPSVDETPWTESAAIPTLSSTTPSSSRHNVLLHNVLVAFFGHSITADGRRSLLGDFAAQPITVQR